MGLTRSDMTNLRQAAWPRPASRWSRRGGDLRAVGPAPGILPVGAESSGANSSPHFLPSPEPAPPLDGSSLAFHLRCPRLAGAPHPPPLRSAVLCRHRWPAARAISSSTASHTSSPPHPLSHYVKNKGDSIRRRGIKKRLLCVIEDASRNKASPIAVLPAPTDNPCLLCLKIGDAGVQAASPVVKETHFGYTCLLYVY